MADRIAVMADGRVQQVATPLDLYRRPVNLFVADFVGTSNILAGHREGDGFLSQELGQVPTAGATGPTGKAHLVVRPEDVRLAPAGDAVPERGVAGTVADVQFKGGSTQVAVDVRGLPRPFLASVAGATQLRRGDHVRVTWDAAVVVPDELA